MKKEKKVEVVSTTTYPDVKTDELFKLTPNKQYNEKITLRYPNPLNNEELLVTEFEVMDGIAYGKTTIDGEEREVVATYPLANFINKTSPIMKNKIKEVRNITEDRDITIVEILLSYCTFTII